MADIAKFAVVLEDLVSPGASKSKAAVDSLSSSLKKAKSDLSGYKSQLSLAKEMGDIEGFRKYSGLVKDSQSKIFGLAQQLEGASPAAGGFASALGELGAVAGPVAAAVGAAAGAVYAFVKITQGAISIALEESQANKMIVSTFNALGSAADGTGQKVLGVIDELETKLPQGQKQLADWAKHIQAMGVTDLGQLKTQLIATASAQAIMGDSGAAAYTKLQERVQLAVEAHHGLKLSEKSLSALYKAGLNQADVAKRMGMTTQELAAKLKAGTVDAKKFGDVLTSSLVAMGKGPLETMMGDIGVIGEKAKKVFGDLFEDVDTAPLTNGLRDVIFLLDSGQPAGAAMKAGITGALNAVIRVIGHAITEGTVFFLGLEVKALQAYIALKPLIGAIDKISGAFGAVASIPGKFVGAGGAIGGALGGEEGAKAGESSAKAIVAGFTGGPLAGIGSTFIDLITSLGDAKAQEIARTQGKAIGEAALEGIREGTQTHSPSVAAMKIGADIGAGLGMGMVDSPAPEQAARTISGHALGALGPGGVAGAFGGGANDNGGTTIGPIEINIMAPDGVTDAHAISVAGLSAVLERFQLGSGR